VPNNSRVQETHASAAAAAATAAWGAYSEDAKVRMGTFLRWVPGASNWAGAAGKALEAQQSFVVTSSTQAIEQTGPGHGENGSRQHTVAACCKPPHMHMSVMRVDNFECGMHV